MIDFSNLTISVQVTREIMCKCLDVRYCGFINNFTDFLLGAAWTFICAESLAYSRESKVVLTSVLR